MLEPSIPPCFVRVTHLASQRSCLYMHFDVAGLAVDWHTGYQQNLVQKFYAMLPDPILLAFNAAGFIWSKCLNSSAKSWYKLGCRHGDNVCALLLNVRDI